jgi:phage baseplate assembly protein W
MYKGFSSITDGKKFRLTDFELVKRDLQNHFYIRKGEKLMNPNFGTIIWDMIFEPLTQETKNVIIQDIKKIIENDPRVSAKNVIVTQYEHGIQIELELIYISTGQIETLELQFERNSQTSTTNL